MTKLCGCGNCEQATERALGLICKMLADGECIGFVAGVTCSMDAVMKLVMAMDDDGKLTLLSSIAAVADYDNINGIIQGHLEQDDVGKALIKETHRRVLELAAARKQEQDLPKGD